MADDPIDTVLDEMATWATSTVRPVQGDSEEADMLLRLLADHLGVQQPEDITPGDLEELLLEVYPRKVTVLRTEETADVVPTVRDLLAFCADTGRLQPATVAELEREVARVEPRFAEAVMDPSNWGMARSITQAMAEDGIDFSDQDAMNRWIESYNESLPGNPYAGPANPEPYDEEEEDPFDGAALREMLDLPDRLPPMRLPQDEELAAAARESRLLATAKELALWAGEHRVVEDGLLDAADTVAAARALGIELPEAASRGPEPVPGGMPTSPAVSRMADVPELCWLWQLAEETGFLHLDATAAATDPSVAWPDGTDDDILDTWETALGVALSRFLVLMADADARTHLDFTGVSGLAALTVFLAGDDGIAVAELNELIKASATAAVAPTGADRAWDAWVKAHGAPAEALLAQMEELGAAQVDSDGLARLSALTRAALREQLLDVGVEVPLLPAVEDMTAADLVGVGVAGDERAGRRVGDVVEPAWS